MKSPQLHMAYHCALKSSNLHNTTAGKFCSQCSKHIPDMKNSSSEEIIDEIKKSDGDFCGSFDPLQLQNPFGDRRDKIVNWYQQLSLQPRAKLIMLFAFAVLVITGCRARHTRGYPGFSYDGVPVIRVHPRSLIEFTDSPDYVKHNVYKIHLKMKKEKKIRKNRYKHR